MPTAPNRTALVGQVQVGVLGDDDRVVAAQLQDGPAQPAGHGLADMRRPIRQEPVALIRGRRLVVASIFSPTSAPRPTTTLNTPAISYLSITGAMISITARAVKGVLELKASRTTTSPQTAAMRAFQDQTATGKLKAVITPIGPRGSHCS